MSLKITETEKKDQMDNEYKLDGIASIYSELHHIEAKEQYECVLSGYASGLCFDFNPYIKHVFLVGTEEGNIHKCSKSYTGQYLETYKGHSLAVFTVHWNRNHSTTFLSCSADWTIKLWEERTTSAIMSFDLGCPVSDVQWSP